MKISNIEHVSFVWLNHTPRHCVHYESPELLQVLQAHAPSFQRNCLVQCPPVPLQFGHEELSVTVCQWQMSPSSIQGARGEHCPQDSADQEENSQSAEHFTMPPMALWKLAVPQRGITSAAFEDKRSEESELGIRPCLNHQTICANTRVHRRALRIARLAGATAPARVRASPKALIRIITGLCLLLLFTRPSAAPALIWHIRAGGRTVVKLCHHAAEVAHFHLAGRREQVPRGQAPSAVGVIVSKLTRLVTFVDPSDLRDVLAAGPAPSRSRRCTQNPRRVCQGAVSSLPGPGSLGAQT